MTTRAKRRRVAWALAPVAVLAFVAAASLAVATTGKGVHAWHLPGAGNPGKTCAFLDDTYAHAGTTWLELKQEPVPMGVSVKSDGVLSVTINRTSGSSFNWTSNIGVDAVVVKNGIDGANLYVYDGLTSPADGTQGTTGGTFRSQEETSDTNLTTPGTEPGGFKDISHISFCYDAPTAADPLTAEKTAEGTYDRTVEWELQKSVDPDSHSGNAGEDAGDSDWTVEATKHETLDNYQVSGEITISNSNAFPVSVEVDDELNDDTVADVDCGSGSNTGTVPANGDLVCTYTASPEDDSADLNTAAISSITANVAGATATAPVSFTENLIGDDEVTLADERFDYEETISSTTTEVFPETFPCPSDPDEYEDGLHERTEENIATLTGDDTDESADAAVDITCTLPALEVEKTADGTFDRTITWTLEKSVDPESHSGLLGDEFESEWKVVATKHVVEDTFEVTGSITIDNPAAIDQDFTVSDALDDATVADVDCDPDTEGNQASGTIPAGGQVVCTYSASPGDASAEENEATVSAAGNEDQTAKAPIAWVANVDGDEETTLTDTEGPLDEALEDSDTFTYTGEFECPTDLSLYVNRLFEFQVTNIANLTGDNTDLEAEATVAVRCERPARPSIDITEVKITSASKNGGGGSANGFFKIKNASSGDITTVTLGQVNVYFTTRTRGTLATHQATCTVTPQATGYTLAPHEEKKFTFSCTGFNPSIPSQASEITAWVKVVEMWNQLGEQRDGPPPTSSNPFKL